MTPVFRDELRRQREDAIVLLHQAERSGDEDMVWALQARLDDLADIAARNGIAS